MYVIGFFMEERHRNILLFVILILFGYWSFLILQPFVSYIILGIILAFLWHPIYRWLAARMNDASAAILSLIIILLLIIIPSILLTASLIGQANNAYQAAADSGITGASIFERLQTFTRFDITPYFNEALNTGKNAVAAAIPALITSTSGILVGLVVFFFVFYYALKEGRDWYHGASNALPIKKAYKKRLTHEIESMTRALFYGQVLTAVLIGIGCGAVFMLLGIPNALFWGFIMMLLAFLPLLGAPIVYIPAGIILIFQDRWAAGVGIILLCTVIIFLVEYIVRPKFVSRTSEIHPLIVIIGALGGIYFLGFIGFLVGPLILGIFMTLLEFDYVE
jgi:predicted PurR-regulated permease PerM